jgi:hypothetical protein
MFARRASSLIAVIAIGMLNAGCIFHSDLDDLRSAVKSSTPEELREWAAQVAPYCDTNWTQLPAAHWPGFLSQSGLPHRMWYLTSGPDGTIELFSPGAFEENFSLAIGSPDYVSTDNERHTSYKIFNGVYVRQLRMWEVRMIKDWPEKVQAAQQQATYSIGGTEFQRIRYGEEQDDWGADQDACHDCRAVKGQFHVVGCDGEECPVCHGQALSCDCPYDDTDED